MEKSEFEIGNLERLRENNKLEVKKAKNGIPNSVWETYSAFANTDGGVVVLGVEELKDHKLKVVGVDDAYRYVADVWNTLNNPQKVSINILTERMVRVENIDGKDVVVMEVPRAERNVRPVYINRNPETGTYRRNFEGDYHCTKEQLSAIYRDASQITMDATVITDMELDVFCQDTVKAYRQVFRNSNPNHLWNNLDDEMFLRRIKAVDVGDDDKYHPTQAGLLMFGYEYEIVRVFPQYFLDYQEDRDLIGVTRWKDRIVSSSGEWSGNVFDFVFKILTRLTSDLKVPFVLKGTQRVDDTPLHKVIREAVINSLVHADYFGRQGVVISKDKNGFVFANPGRMRLPVAEAVGGGVSDPRNGVLLKIFSLIRFGERAGSGLNGIFYVWNKVFHANAKIEEKENADRTVLTLPFDGHEQDVQAMIQMYDNPEELKLIDENTCSDIEIENSDTEVANSDTEIENSDIEIENSDTDIANSDTNVANSDTNVANSDTTLTPKQIEVLLYCVSAKSAKDILSHLDLSYHSKNIRKYVMELVEKGFLAMRNPESPRDPHQRYYTIKKLF